MKRILSFLFISICAFSSAQLTYTRSEPLSLEALSGISIYNSTQTENDAGTFSGAITSIQFSATKSGGNVNPSDLAVYITNTTGFATGGLFLAGGVNTVMQAQQYQAWSTVNGNNISGTFTLANPITLAAGTTIRIMNANGTLGEAGITGETGEWSNISLVINGISPVTFTLPSYCASYATPANNSNPIVGDGNVVNFSWGIAIGVIPNHTKYNFYLGETSDDLVLFGAVSSTTTSINLSFAASDSNKTFYWKVVPVNVNAEANCSTVWSFNLGDLDVVYCNVGSSTNNTYEYLEGISFVNTSMDLSSENAYVYYDELSFATVEAGNTYDISVDVVSDAQDSLYVFLDWNQDGDFNDESEMFTIESNFNTSGNKTGQIEVPEGAINGVTRMRVYLAYATNSVNINYGCANVQYGDIRDFIVTVTGGVASIAQFDKSNISVYPNPANNLINIVSVDVVDSIVVTDMNGRVVKRVVLGAESSQIDISDLSKGIYILNIKSKGTSEIQKIIKQ